MDMDAIDKKLLDIIQTDFPIAPRPYAVLGERAMRESKIIRRLGANFQSAKLGFRSTLCAAKVPSEKMEAFIAEVNGHPGVTHNYIRDHAYNIWFSYIGPTWEAVRAALDDISRNTGISILNLPASRVYKIRVDFRMEE